MEQRSEPRIAVSAEVRVDVLGDGAHSFTAELVNISSRGMRLAVPAPLPPDSAVRIRLDRDQYLGEVMHHSLEGGRLLVGVSLYNVIHDVDAVTERLGRILLPH